MDTTFASFSSLAGSRGGSVSVTASQWKRRLQATALSRPFDRIQALGKLDGETGHTGCVNALSWAMDGEVLLSSGDDTTVRMWRMDTSQNEDCPWACTTVIHTGHRSNIFNAQMLPGSSRIATVARDKQVRVSDVGYLSKQVDFNSETVYTTAQANVRIIRCHRRAVKRVTMEDSPDLFLTVSEDGSVRQHDLRVPHDCRTQDCPAPLVQLEHPLSTLALSPLSPYQFVVAGESQYGYLFDRRHTGRRIQSEWGVPLDKDSVTTCVRRFGRKARGSGETTGFEHVTGARMASGNGHEVLLSYSSDAIHLFSTLDTPTEATESSDNAVLPFNPTVQHTSSSSSQSSHQDRAVSGAAFRRAVLDQVDAMMEEDIQQFMTGPMIDQDGVSSPNEAAHDDDDISDPNEDIIEEEEEEEEDQDPYSTTPVILPRRHFKGHCNVETVKDVNFLGPYDEYVVSGSDDGNWFIWDKSTGKLRDILEGDGNVVNVVEGHPHLPLVAVSGIDTTVKLFGPSLGPSRFSRLGNTTSITSRNADASSQRIELASLATYARMVRLIGAANAGDHDDEEQPCTTQ